MDLRLAWRRLLRNPAATAVAVATLGLAIGANTAILGIADAILFRSLDYGEPDRLRVVQMRDPATGARFFRIPPEYLDAIEQTRPGITDVGYFESVSPIIAPSEDGAEAVPAAAVSVNYLEILDVRPAMGRFFNESDRRSGGRAAILSYSAWQSRFGGSRSVIGGATAIGGASFDVIGVLPPGFVFPTSLAGSPDVVTVLPDRPAGEGAFQPIVRLASGVSPDRAQAELDAIVSGVRSTDASIEQTVPVFDGVRSALYSTGRPIMLFLLAAAGLVLLIACANLANLFLAASRRREREIGVSGALGARPLRLIRPILIETIVIAVLGAGLALTVAAYGFDALLRIVPADAVGAAPVGVDARVAGFALALGLLAGLLTAVLPALRIAELDPQEAILDRTRRGAVRFGRPMVGFQVALAVVVVFGAAIAARAFVSILNVPLGFTPEAVAVLELRAEGADGAQREDFYRRAVQHLLENPAVLSAGATGSLPIVDGVPYAAASAATGEPPSVSIVHVLPGYFETVGLELRGGRALGWDDLRGTSGALLSESAARLLFDDGDPIGSTILDHAGRARTVVGVVADVRMRLEDTTLPPVYVLPGSDTRRMTLVTRTHAADGETLERIRQDVARFAPGSVVTARWWSDAIGALTPYRNPRFQTVVLSCFAVLSLTVTALGVFAVIAFTIASRRREMGIRLALGVPPRGLAAMMVRYALEPVAWGLIAGLIATRALARLAEAQLFDVETRDPVVLVAVALTVLGTTMIAAWLPARRAGRMDPLVTLRAD